LLAVEMPMITIRKLVSVIRMALSFGSRTEKRITPSLATKLPTMITSPSTSSAFANTEPTSDVCATTVSPADSAKSTTKNSGRFPSVDWRVPVTAGPKRPPTCSVANDTSQASPARATVARTNARTGVASA
jgi:hypothetical protein